MKNTHALSEIAHAITANASAGRDEAGGYVSSLTEAVMGITKGLCRIAEALDNVAESIRESNSVGEAIAQVGVSENGKTIADLLCDIEYALGFIASNDSEEEQ